MPHFSFPFEQTSLRNSLGSTPGGNPETYNNTPEKGSKSKMKKASQSEFQASMIDANHDVSILNGQMMLDDTQEIQYQQDQYYGTVSLIWENLLLVTIVYNFFTVCFYFGIRGFPSGAWLYLEYITEMIMIVDIFTRYIIFKYVFGNDSNQRGAWPLLNMLRNKSDEEPIKFIFMIASSLPTSIVLYSTLPVIYHSTLWVAAVRILKLYRMRQFQLYFDVKDVRAKKDSYVRTIEALIFILMATHFLGCFWLFIGHIDPNQDLNWFKLVMYDKYDVPDAQKYIDSIFFVVSSMTGLGFAYIYPRTDLEYAMQSLIMLLGVSLYANFFAFFTVTIYNRNKKRIENMMKFEESKELAVLRSFPSQIRDSTRVYYNTLRLKYNTLCETYQVLHELPKNLRSEMSLFINSELIQKINFFQFAEPDLILRMSKSLVPELALQDYYVVKIGEVATKMYFIKSGIVQVLATDNKTIIAYMSEGTYFGEIGVLLTHKRSCTIQAKTVSVFFTIEKDELMPIIQDYPLHLKYLKSVAKQRLQTTEPEDISCENEEIFNDLMLQQIEGNQENQKSANINHVFTVNSNTDQSFIGQNNAQHTIPRDFNFLQQRFGADWYLTSGYEKVPYFIITPFSKLFNIWSIIFTIAFTFNILYVPFCIGLDYTIPIDYIEIDICVMVITLLDTILRPFLAVNKNLEIQTDRRKLLQQYIKYYFLLDLLATIPFDYLFLLTREYSMVAIYFKLLRMLKLYRLFEISSIINQHSQVNVLIFRLISLFFAFIFIAHWFNCFLLYFGRWELYQHRRFDGKSLLEYLTRSSSVKLPPPEHQTAWQLYFNLIVLAVCFMGSIVYGDIIPFTLSEELVSIIEMIIGRMFIAFLFAEMSSYVQIKYQAYNDHIIERNVIIKWIELNNIEPSLKARVHKYFDFKWQNKKGVKEEELIDDLPQSLYKDVLQFIFEDLIANCEVFPRENPGAIRSITRRLRRKLVPRDEFVIRQGELASDMYFIMKGEVRVVTATGVTLATLGKNKHFGEMALIQETASVRSTSIVANSNVQLAVLTKQDFKLICENYPEFKTKMKEIIDQRAKDSLKKGVAISNQTQEKRESVSFRNLSNLSASPVDQSQPVVIPPSPIRQTTIKNQINNLELSMIEEESRKGDSVQDHISRSHSMNESNFRQRANVDRSGRSGDDVPKSLRRGSTGRQDSSDDSKSNHTPMFQKRVSQSRRKSIEPVQTSINSLRNSKLFKNNLEIIQDQENEELENNIIESQNNQGSPTKENYLSAEFKPQVITTIEDEDESKNDEKIQFDNEQNSRPHSRASANIAIADQHMFEKSLEENPFYLLPGMRLDGPGVSMGDIEKPNNANNRDDQHDQHTRIDATPREFNQTQDPQSTHRSLVQTQQPEPSSQNKSQLTSNAQLNNAVKFSSSTSNFEEYLWQLKGSAGAGNATFVSMFLFYAFKCLLIFPISIYNIVFIPIQMGFSTPFVGWLLFMEIMTIILYTVDLFFIIRHYRNIKKHSFNNATILPIDSSNYKENLRNSDHDKDEIEIKLIKIRLDLLTSTLAIFPFSLIFQNHKNTLFVVNFLRVLRMAKLVPGYRVLQALKRYYVNFSRLLEIIISYYIVAHVAAGVMLSVGLSKAPDISDTWLNKVPIPLPANLTVQNNSYSVDQTTFYIHAIYFTSNTISHVAIGDLTSVTIEERVLNAFLIWVFTFFYSLLFANISVIFNTENTFLQFNEKYQYVRKTLPLKKLNQKTVNKIDNYFEYLWMTSHGNDEVKQIYRMLPPQMMYDAIRDRYLEAFEHSYLFKADLFDVEQNQLDYKILNSFIELMHIQVLMPHDFFIKAGQHDENFYIVLEGEIVMIGLTNEVIAIMEPGSHFNMDLGQDQQLFSSQKIHYGKSMVHLVCQSLTTIGVIGKSQLQALYEAFPDWKLLVQRMNYHTFQLGKLSLDRYSAHKNIYSNNKEELYELELRAIEDHITYSNDEKVYQVIIQDIEHPKNSFLSDPRSNEYKSHSLNKQYSKILQEEIGAKNVEIGDETPSKLKTIGRQNSRNSMLKISGIKRQVTIYESQQGCFRRFLNRSFHFSRNSSGRTVFEFLQLFNIIYICYMVPFSISFVEGNHRLQFAILEGLSTLFSIMIIIVNMRTPIFHKSGLTLKFKHVFSHYLKQGGLLIDLFGALPINFILGGVLNIEHDRVIFALLRLSRVLSLLKLTGLMEKFQIHLKNHTVTVVSFKALLFLTVLWHWTSCIWFFVNLLEYDYYTVTWIKKFDLLNKTLSERYLYSMYYVIKIVTGVGQSDMIAYNNLERICFIIIINIGDALFAIAFGLISQVQFHISDNSTFQQYVSKLKQIETFIQNIKAESVQKRRVEQFFNYNSYLQTKKKTLETEDLQQHLPFSLVQEIVFMTQKDILAPMFKSFKSENMLKDLSFMMKNSIYMPGDYIIVKDQVAEEMYFIKEGSVNVIGSDKNTILKTLYKGNFFGEIAIFMKTTRIAFVQARSPCVIGILMKSDIEKIMVSYPQLGKEFLKEANKRIRETFMAEELRNIHQTAYSLSGNSSQASVEEEINGSFIQALQQKIENNIETQSVYSDKTLVTKLKRNSVLMKGMQEYVDQTNNHRRASINKQPSSDSQNFHIEVKKATQGQQPPQYALGQKNAYAGQTKKPVIKFTMPQPIQFHRLNTPIKEVITDEEEDSSIKYGQSKQDDRKSAHFPVHSNVGPNTIKMEQSSSSSSSSEQKLSVSDEEEVLDKNHLQVPVPNDFVNSFGTSHKVSNDHVGYGSSLKISSELREEESPQMTSSALMSSQHEEEQQQQYQIFIKEINSNITGIQSQERPLIIKNMMTRSRMNSTNALPNMNSIQLAENKNNRRGSMLGQQAARHQSISSTELRGVHVHHQTSPVLSRKSFKASRLQEVQRQYSQLLFMQIMDNFQDEPLPESPAPLGRQASSSPLNSIQNGQHGGTGGGPKSITTVRRQPKKKKPKRRLSKLQMGKNLMISNTAGLKLQWTVQGGQQ